jgi:hypothetical protein
LSPSSLSAPSPASIVSRGLACRRLPFDQIPHAAWERLLERTPAATPFARWTVHRAWWDAYGSTAHEEYLVAVGAGGHGPTGAAPTARDAADIRSDDIRGIVPLMHRHMAEPQDGPTATILRRGHQRGTRVRPDAKAIFFGASYHCDYATLLADPADLPDVVAGLVATLAGGPDPTHGDQPWDVIDLRRLRSVDPALPALQEAFAAGAERHGWQLIREPEDVCPVVSFDGADWDAYLATLSKKSRHEIRRKIRRAEAHGPLTVRRGRPSPEAVARFVDLHTARFGDEGLFPPTEGGRRSRLFIERLAELESAAADGAQLDSIEVLSGERLIFVALAFDDGETCYLYNAGMDPAASELSPGVTGTAAYLRDRLEHGRKRFDFLRGDEPYKYEWGARDEIIERLIAMRRDAA